MFLLDQPETEPTLGDVRVTLRPPPSIDPTPVEVSSDTRAHYARVIVGFVSVTVVFQVALGRLLSWWLDV
jgi:hypothetical protein